MTSGYERIAMSIAVAGSVTFPAMMESVVPFAVRHIFVATWGANVRLSAAKEGPSARPLSRRKNCWEGEPDELL